MTLGERIFAALLRLYPREFRSRYGSDLLAFFRHDRTHPRYGSGPLRPLRFWRSTVNDLLRAAWAARVTGRGRSPVARAVAGASDGWLSRRARDVRGAWRGLSSSPGVAATCIVVLTVGIGASTAIYSVVDAVALRRLPFQDPQRLVAVNETDLQSAGRPLSAAWQNYVEWLARQDVYTLMGASASAGSLTTAAGDGPVESLRAVLVTPSLFAVLGVAPALGRGFIDDDTRAEAVGGVILSDRLWRRRFGASAAVIGRAMRFENGTREIVGVMPEGFAYPIWPAALGQADLWIPRVAGPRDLDRTGGRTYSLSVVARLRPGVTIEQANVRMTQIRDALAAEHPRWFEDRGIVVRPMHESVVSASVRSWMLLLLAAVACVLLIACLNVANLLVARAFARRREVAVRAALGASRWDLARAMLTESLLLAMLASAAGVLLAVWGASALRATLPDTLPRLSAVSVDLRVLAVAIPAAILTCVSFSLLPALRFSAPDLAGDLRQAGRGEMGGGSERLRGTLVVAEVALAVILLAGAGLFLASFVRTVNVALGMDTRQVVAVSVSPRVPPDVPRLSASHALVRLAFDAAGAVPGVDVAALLAGGLPLGGGYMTVPVTVPSRGRTFTGPDEVLVHPASASYRDVVHLTLLRGRFIEGGDTAAAPPVVVLTEEAVRRYFPDSDPIGRTIVLHETARRVVGVVADVRHGGPEWDLKPESFVPYVQGDQPSAHIVFRVDGSEAAVGRAVQAAVHQAVPTAVVGDPYVFERRFAVLVAQRKFNMLVLALFGALAVAIAAVGLYGLMAFLVAQRTPEIGLRLALGAAPAGVLRMVLGRAGRLVAAGLGIGLAGAVALERFVRAFLFDARQHDPSVYAAVALCLTGVGLAAAFGPARRAARVDPLVALRLE